MMLFCFANLERVWVSKQGSFSVIILHEKQKIKSKHETLFDAFFMIFNLK